VADRAARGGYASARGCHERWPAAGWTTQASAWAPARCHFERVPRDRSFGNGRYARQVLDEAITRQAGRLRALGTTATVDDLRTLHPTDVRT
jgi:hypothetical protein